MSQFWYDDNTTETLSKAALKCISNKGKVALISCPTLFKKLKENLQEGEGKIGSSNKSSFLLTYKYYSF